MIHIGTDNELKMTHGSNNAQATPRPRKHNVPPLDSDGDVEFTEPYKTPMALQRQKKHSAPAPVMESDSESEIEMYDSEPKVEESQRRKESKRKGQFEVCSRFD
jgi:hypothetical protein